MLLILIILFSFCGFYVFYVSFLNVNTSIGKHFRSTLVVFFNFMCHLNRNDLTSIINHLVY